MRLRRRGDGRDIVACVEARLQLVDPVKAGSDRHTRIALEVLFELVLIEPVVAEGAELRRQAAQRPDQPELPGDSVDHEAEPNLPHELERMLGFLLDVAERITADEEERNPAVVRVGRKGEVADFLRRVDGVSHQRAAGAHVLRPGDDAVAESSLPRAALKRSSPRFSTRSTLSLPKRNPAW